MKIFKQISKQIPKQITKQKNQQSIKQKTKQSIKQTIKQTLLTSSLLLMSSNAFANTLTFTIDGIKNAEGKILVQIFSGEENYNQGIAFSGMMVNAKKGKVKVLFGDLPKGEYAIRYFHDQNDNGELESNLLGMPTEGYGFSNNAKANFGPAKYQSMKFIIAQANTKNSSTVSY